MLVWGWIAVDIRPGELATGGDKMYEMIFGGVTPRGLEKQVSFQIRGQIFHFIQAGIPGRHTFMKWSLQCIWPFGPPSYRLFLPYLSVSYPQKMSPHGGFVTQSAV